VKKRTKTISRKKAARVIAKAARAGRGAKAKPKAVKKAKHPVRVAPMVKGPAASLAVTKAVVQKVSHKIVKARKIPVGELRAYKDLLEKLRDRVMDEITFLAGDNLNRSQRDSSGDLSSYSFHMADQGTDNFDREFALNLVSSEQDVLYEINEALHRIDERTYGVCESCGQGIEKARLNALPFAKMCVRCKSESEKGKARYRPFGPTISQAVEPS
jgi:DnaK suppressor protein